MPWPCPFRFETHSAQATRVSVSVAVATLLLLGSWASGSAQAQLLLVPNDGAPSGFPVSQLELTYSRPDSRPDSSPESESDAESDASASTHRPALSRLVPVRVELHETDAGWAAPQPGEATQSLAIGGSRSDTVRLTPSGLALTLREVVSALHDTGLYGIDVRPSSEDIDLENERDLRPAGRSVLRLVVTIGRVNRIRTIAVGDRVDGEWRIDNELHDGIRAASPIQPLGSADDDSTDLLDRNALEDYLHRLNRHPGRRVEAALSPDVEPGNVVLDYRVAESKPWYGYAQVSNTGTRRTSNWQTRVGAVHRQLTNRDDILAIEYLNGGRDVNGIRAKYEAPFFGPKRPDWMKRRTGDPAWIDWVPREKIPWWGVDRLRWNLDLSYGRFETGSTIVTIQEDAVVSEQVQFGGQLIYEAYQRKNFFIDVFGGLRLRNLRVQNKLQGDAATGKQNIFLSRGGVRARRVNAISNLGIEVGAEGTLNELDESEKEQLGRTDVDRRFAKLDFNLGYSTYLEPVVFPNAFRDPETKRSSTLAHEVAVGFRGQYAFDYRLIPQASQIVGGLYSVRGFKQSRAVGDSVFIGSFEYRFHIPRALPIMREPLDIPLLGDFRATPQQVYGRPDWDFILRAFVDVGRALRNREDAVPRTQERDETLVGVGLGAELQFRSNLRARLDWATPLTRTAPDGQTESRRFGGNNEFHLLFSILY